MLEARGLTKQFGGLTVVLVAAAGGLRWRRRRTWAASPLEFEDEDPARMQQLGLGPS